MSDSTIMSIMGFLVALVAVLAPILSVTTKLNTQLARLTEALDNLEANWREGHANLNGRVSEHGKQIDELEKTAVNHEARITNLEGGKE